LRPATAGHPPANPGDLAAPAPGWRPAVPRRQGRPCPRLWRTTLYQRPSTDPAPEAEDAGQVLPVRALRGPPGPLPVGLLPWQGGGLRLPLPPARAALVSWSGGLGGARPRPAPPVQVPADAAANAGAQVALGLLAQGESRR